MNTREAAIYYIEQKALLRAERLLKKWILDHPDDLDAHKELIWCFLKNGDSLKRWRRCDQFYKEEYLMPNSQVIRYYVQAEQCYHEEKNEDALMYYKATLDGGFDVSSVHHNIAMAHKTLGQVEDAKKEYENALLQNKNYLPTIQEYGRLLFDDGRFDRFETIMKSLNQSKPELFKYQYPNAMDDIEDLLVLKKACKTLRHSIHLRNEGNVEEAARLLWPEFLKQTDNCWFIRTMIYLFYRADWLSCGKKRIKEIITEESTYFSYAQGLLFWYEDKVEEALKAYSAAINEGLMHPLVYSARSLVLGNLAKEEEQERDLIAAIINAQWCIYARSEFALLKYKHEDYQEMEFIAHVTLEEYQLAKNYDISGMNNLAMLEQTALSSLLKQNKAQEALLRVENYNRPCENNYFRFGRAMVYAENLCYDKAASELKEAVKLESQICVNNRTDIERLELITQNVSDCFSSTFILSLLPAFNDDFTGAIKKLQTLIQSYPNEPEAWYHLASVLSLLKETEQAKSAFEQTLSIKNNHKEALSSLCWHLKNEGDINSLQSLFKKYPNSIEPLENILELAKEQGLGDIAKKTARQILNKMPNNTKAVFFLMEGLDPKSMEHISLVEPLVEAEPFNFEAQALIARNLLLNRVSNKSQKKYQDLFLEKYDSLNGILMLGIACISSNDHANKQ